VILTIRDPDRWWQSYNDTIGHILRSRRTHLAEALNPFFFGKFMGFSRLCSAVLLGSEYVSEDEAKARFVAHYDKVRGTVPSERLLEYRVGEGWERLCSFLGDSVPEVDFPRTNDTKMIRARAQTASARVFRGVGLGVVLPALCVVSACVIMYMRRGRA
jgi:hypothetical protein